MTNLLDVQDLQVRFFTPEGVVHAVEGVTLSLDEGETLALVGESGCGKTVTARAVMRLIPWPPGKITEGNIQFQNRDVLAMQSDELRHFRGGDVAMIFQEPMTSLNPVFTIEEQLTEAIELHQRVRHTEAVERAVKLLSLTGIPTPEERLKDYPHQLSGGMRQRVMIAMAISCNPKLLIADEPTTALDVTIQAQFIDIVKRLRDEMGMAVIWITHDLGVVAGLAQRVAVMYAGYIVEMATVKDLYADPRHPYTLGLLGSIPRLDAEQKRKLTPIEGLPPDLIDPKPQCPFAPRCHFQKEHQIERCLQENPLLEPAAAGHNVACWFDVSKGSVK